MLAAPLLERVSDPSHGRDVNESETLHFHAALRADSSLAQLLAHAELADDDVETMSAGAWLWYLGWRVATGAEQPDDRFLDALYDRTTIPALRLKVVQISLRNGRDTWVRS